MELKKRKRMIKMYKIVKREIDQIAMKIEIMMEINLMIIKMLKMLRMIS